MTAARGRCDGRRNLVFRKALRKINSFGRWPSENQAEYEQKRDLGHITLKIVAHDEQKRDLGHITLKIVTGGWRTAGNDESNEESSAEKCARALRWPSGNEEIPRQARNDKGATSE